MLKIVNENKKKLHIKIVPEGTYKTGFKIPEYTIEKESYLTLTIMEVDIDSKNFFSIKGETNWVSLGYKCQNLSVNKDYRVIFQRKPLGTACIAEEIPPEEKPL